MPEGAPLLLYDGHCALCNGSVRFLLRFDPRGPLRFAPISGPTGTRILTANPDLQRIDSLILVEGERISSRSTAVLRLLRYLGWPWKVLLVGYLVPREIRDSLYDVVAHWRYRLFGRHETCPVPPADQRHRFLL